MLVYELIRVFMNLIGRWILRYRTFGKEHLPTSGGYLLVTNHASVLDPILVGYGVDGRQLHFLAKSDLFHPAPWAWLIRYLGAVPVRRGAVSPRTFKAVEDLVTSGKILLVFPEGTRSRDGDLGSARRGAGFMSLRMNVPVIPGRIHGSFDLMSAGRFWPRLPGRITMTFGKAVDLQDLRQSPDSREAQIKAAERIMAGIREL